MDKEIRIYRILIVLLLVSGFLYLGLNNKSPERIVNAQGDADVKAIKDSLAELQRIVDTLGNRIDTLNTRLESPLKVTINGMPSVSIQDNQKVSAIQSGKWDVLATQGNPDNWKVKAEQTGTWIVQAKSQQWEYGLGKVPRSANPNVPVQLSDLQNSLTSLGNANWELLGTYPADNDIILVFKRPK